MSRTKKAIKQAVLALFAGAMMGAAVAGVMYQIQINCTSGYECLGYVMEGRR